MFNNHNTPPLAPERLIIRILFRPFYLSFRLFSFISILIIAALLIPGCAGKREIPREPLGIRAMEGLISSFMDQQDMVDSFYASGSILVKGWILKSGADILIVGVKDPFKIKMEITHPWGAPILHLLIESERIEALSFSEKRVYIGGLTSDVLSRFLPETSWDRDLLWSILRGFPCIDKYYRAEPSGKNMIRLLNEEGNVIELMELSGKALLPQSVVFPEKSLELAFSGFQQKDGVYYAEQITANNIKGGKELILKRDRMVLNHTIPDQIFTLEKPQSFDTVYMDDTT